MKFILYIIAILSLAACQDAQNKHDYFRALTPEELPMALEEANLESCEEFTETYINIDQTRYDSLLMRAIAYDAGICFEQDLSKAVQLYDKAFREIDFLLLPPIRPALIYEFGPQEVRNAEKAAFLMKQSAIVLYTIRDEDTRNAAINGFLNKLLYEGPIPPSLQKELDWMEEVIQKTTAERKEIALALQKKGFRETMNIWNPIEDVAPKYEK